MLISHLGDNFSTFRSRVMAVFVKNPVEMSKSLPPPTALALSSRRLDMGHPQTIIPDICHFIFTHTFSGLKILQPLQVGGRSNGSVLPCPHALCQWCIMCKITPWAAWATNISCDTDENRISSPQYFHSFSAG